MIKYGGLLWPTHDVTCLKVIWSELYSLEKVISNTPRKRVAVQAGGNVGVFAKRLAEEFELVHTFEPDEQNYECLKLNATEPNIRTYEAALGATNGFTSLTFEDGNCGAHYVGEGHYTPMVTIDSLGLEHCDLIYLDIEGYEMEALKGAAETIKRCRPTIAIEDKGLIRRYEAEVVRVSPWVAERFNYEIVASFGADILLKPGD